jgi:hypothetical protein
LRHPIMSRSDDDTAPPLANVNEVLDSEKEAAAGDGDEDMGTDDDQPTLPLAFKIDLNRHQVRLTGPEGHGIS